MSADGAGKSKSRTSGRHPVARPEVKRETSLGQRLRRARQSSLAPGAGMADANTASDVVLDCGWGNLVFAQTFRDQARLVGAVTDEARDRRNIALYVQDPHVLLAAAPNRLFLDPSHTYRLDLAGYRAGRRAAKGYRLRRLLSEQDAHAVNRIYARRGMVKVDPAFFWANRQSRALRCFVAEDNDTGDIIGTVTGVDHAEAFGDPERGTSLWCLAVDPQARHPGIGEMLVRRLAEHFHARGAAHVDLSVLHDNEPAIRLYERLGFRRLPVFAVKHKNPINEKLFAPIPDAYEALNPYARIIVDSAHRRGVQVEITDASAGFFRLSHGGRSVHCRESLSELTSAVAMSICDDKAITRRIVEAAGLTVPEQMDAADGDDALEGFLARHGAVVVKPARGEQGRGIAVGLTALTDVRKAILAARKVCERVLVEACFEGEDLRLVVIDHQVVAAAVRRPPIVVGDGTKTIRALIAEHSRRRASATGGESRIPVDAETERVLHAADLTLDTVLPSGRKATVRRTANLHTGGTITDVTDIVHPKLIEAACRASRAIDIPVTGIDLMVKHASKPDYVFIEANERPGLANHEPQPTAERFVDLLFPQTAVRAQPQAAGEAA